MAEFRQTLDHVAVVVPNVDRAHETYARLGFRLTARSSHKGRLTPGGPVELWGAGNHCAMFHQGYLEILGVTDPARHHAHVTERLERYPGLHLIALGCADAEAAARALVGRLGSSEEVVEVHRDVPYGAGTRPGRFRILRLPEGGFPEAELFYIEHPTREVLWQPELLDQPNGVVALEGVTLCSDSPETTARRLGGLLGRDSEPRDGARRFVLDEGFVEVIAAEKIAARFAAPPPVLPFVAAAHFAVTDLSATRRRLAERGVGVSELGPDGIFVPPDAAEGAVIVFTQTQSRGRG
jgi:hypothetical protein